MKLVSMKRTKAKVKENTKMPSIGGDDYPYGMRLCLEKDELAKLGLKVSDFEVGATFEVIGLAKVTSVSQSQGEYSSSRVELQIQRLGLEEEEENESMLDAVNEGINEAKS